MSDFLTSPWMSLVSHDFLLTNFSPLLFSPPGMTCPTSCTVRAEFLSSVLTLMTPWLRPPMDRMARAGRGAPGTPGLHRREFDQTWTFPTVPSALTDSHLPSHPCSWHIQQTMYSSILLCREKWKSTLSEAICHAVLCQLLLIIILSEALDRNGEGGQEENGGRWDLRLERKKRFLSSLLFDIFHLTQCWTNKEGYRVVPNIIFLNIQSFYWGFWTSVVIFYDIMYRLALHTSLLQTGWSQDKSSF